MIKPINGHILIDPVQYDSFIASDKGIYEEIGIVVDYDKMLKDIIELNIGDKVYFDSWMAAKYPKNNDEFYWLVKASEVRAVEHNEEIPK